MRTRPVGVTILAVLLAVNAVFYVVIAAVALFNRDALRYMLHTLSPSGMGPQHAPSHGWHASPVLRAYGWGDCTAGDGILEIVGIGRALLS